MFMHLEKVIYDKPGGKEQLERTREWMKSIREQSEGKTEQASA